MNIIIIINNDEAKVLERGGCSLLGNPWIKTKSKEYLPNNIRGHRGDHSLKGGKAAISH